SAQLSRHVRRGAAAESAAVVRAQLRIAHHEHDLLHRSEEFFGDDLRQRSADVLADLSFACIDRDLPVLADVQPRADILRTISATSAAASTPTRVLSNGRRHEQQNSNATANGLKKVAATKIEVVGWTLIEFVTLRFKARLEIEVLAHTAPSFIALAACEIAAMIRGYVPHRQMFPFIPRTISSRSGFEFFFKSAIPLMTIPQVQ